MKRRLFSGLFVLALAALGWGAWRYAAPTQSPAPRYRTAAVQRGDIVQAVTASGTLSAITTVEVGSQVSGNITRLCVDYNDTVKAGQLIAQIDPTSYQAKLVQAEADLLSAQATLTLKQLTAQRSADLLAKSLIAQSDYDEVLANLRAQEATTKKAEAAVNNARLDVERCKITSPIDGVVLERAMDVGQTVQSSFSAPTLYTLAQDLRQMQIKASISEADIGSVAAGQSVSFTVDAFPGRTFTGLVREVRNNSAATNNVVTYPTIVTVDNGDLQLRPGMTANVTVVTARRTDVLRVPNAALRVKLPANALVHPTSGTPAAAAPALGQDRPEPSLDQLPAELRTRLLAEFDRDHDGRLDAAEKADLHEKRLARVAAGEAPPAPPEGAPTRTHRPARNASAPATTAGPRTVYLLAHAHTGELVATPVQTGLADSAFTEILSGLSDGATVVTGTLSATAAAAANTAAASATTTNPFAPSGPPGGGAGGPPPPR